MKIVVALFAAFLVAGPAAAQSGGQPANPAPSAPEPPLISLRGFAMITEQRFAAVQTFDAVFGHRVNPFLGGGAQVVIRDQVYLDVAVSRFSKSGHRAFLFNGKAFNTGIPLTATLTPIEVSGGYRFGRSAGHRMIPFAGGGVGWYAYKETAAFADTGDDVDTRHVGYLAVGGVEFPVHRWVRVAVDAQYTHIPGIFGTGGISRDAGETDLGGLAARVRVVIGP